MRDIQAGQEVVVFFPYKPAGEQHQIGTVTGASKTYIHVTVGVCDDKILFKQSDLQEKGESRYSSFTKRIIEVPIPGQDFRYQLATQADADRFNANALHKQEKDRLAASVRKFEGWKWMSLGQLMQVQAVIDEYQNDKDAA